MGFMGGLSRFELPDSEFVKCNIFQKNVVGTPEFNVFRGPFTFPLAMETTSQNKIEYFGED